jgi:tRNA pseudouridine38-40 synthase
MKQYWYKIIVEFDGTEYYGWQIQPGKQTVQGIIQDMIEVYARQEVKLFGSGRTDSGVHALGQVCCFALNTDFPPEELFYRLNQMLPKDIGIKKVSRTYPYFDPRREAISRTYRYYISESPQPLLRLYSYRYFRKMNIDRLNRSAKMFMGEHDFTMLCKASSRKDNNRCHVYQSRWFRYNGLLTYEVNANRFLHHMVRRMTGMMLAYECSKISLTQIEAFLNNSTEENTRFNVPACGLVLIKVFFGRERR